MSVSIPERLRYRTVNFLEGNPSGFLAACIRILMVLPLLLMAVPWPVVKEVAFARAHEKPDLKSSLRSMLWIWNRSWIPLKFRFGTFFDIGWFISESSCRLLEEKGFLSNQPLKRNCDLAQLKLATIRKNALQGRRNQLELADEKLRELVSAVYNGANDWAESADHEPIDSRLPETAGNPAIEPASKPFDNSRTRGALLDFDDLCTGLGLEFFLVSGTFLGVVRDGAFIGHDHDIDVGVFEESVHDTLVPALSNDANFHVTEVDYICLRKSGANGVQYTFMDKPAIIRLAHRSGVSVDVFVHFLDRELAWHGSSVHRWDNLNFELGDYEFLGRSFKGARNFERYLAENYGPDWRIPKRSFNVNFDTPNMSFAGTANALVFFSWILANAAEEQDPGKIAKYIELLVSLGAVESGEGGLVIR